MKQERIVGNYLQDGWKETQPPMRCLKKKGHPFLLFIFPRGGIVYARNIKEAVKAFINRDYYAGIQKRRYAKA